MKPVQRQKNRDFFLFDQDLLEQVDCNDFDITKYQAQGALLGQAQGRGTTHFIRMANELNCVFRHYRRGGWVSRLTEDQYYWTGLNQTRAWREWYLLKSLTEKQLPVPYPVAAHVKRRGLFYLADIITKQIPSTRSLSSWISEDEMDDGLWRLLGKTIWQFHQQGVFHADLNAHNILIDDQENFFLIDFDKGELRKPASAWQRNNIDRLQRSLQKLKQQNPDDFHFSLHHWGALLQAYSSGN